MRFSRLVLASALVFATMPFATAIPAMAYMHARRGPTSPGLFKKRSGAKTSTHAPGRPLGPRAMDSGRATQIQAALIRSGYLSGTPTGRWDSESEAAMQKLQGSNGWQTKLTPDSRALILLGLGPNQDQSVNLGTGPGRTDLIPSTERAGSSLVIDSQTQMQ